MVKTEKALIYHNVKLLASRHDIDLYQFKRYKRGSKIYWKKILFKIKVMILERLYVKRYVLGSLPWSIELLIYKFNRI
jgi:hypothetical protein